MTTLPRFLPLPLGSFFLFGPRGTGKTTGLTAFGDEYPEARRVLLHRGAHRLMRKGVLCLPVEEFLRGLHPERGLEEAVSPTAPAPSPAPATG